MAGVWAVLAVLCLASHAHAQLGETEEEEDHTRAWAASDSEGESGGEDVAWVGGTAEEDEEKEEEEEEEMVVRMRTPRRWLALQETYKGCLPGDDNFRDSLMFLNLTEVAENHWLGSVEEACYQVCLNKVPFSLYLTHSPAFNGSVDTCGCHLNGELNLDNVGEDEGCDEDINRYRVYCGPYNLQCYGRAGGPGTPSLLLLALPLLLALLSGLADVGPTSTTYFGFNR